MAIENLLILRGIVSIILLSSEFERCAFFEEVSKEAEDGASLSCMVNLALITVVVRASRFDPYDDQEEAFLA
jgi:hypothetical protein